MNTKIKSREEIVELVEELRNKGKTIGFTSGAFDILHAGHIDYLYKAKEVCDVLILGLNSDESIKKYKDQNRPINNFKFRAKVACSLEMIDFVFGFEEVNNNINVELIKPDFYIKAGDYTKEKLSSASIVEKFGGKVVLIPVQNDTSTSKTIQKLIELEKLKSFEVISESIDLPKLNEKVKVVFVDRDGTINKELSYLHEPEKFVLEKNVPEGLRKIQDLGYKLVVVTDQSGIGLGYFTKEDMFKVHGQMFKLLLPFNLKIDRIYFCPHSIEDNCNCRKPKTGLLEKAMASYSNMIDLENSYFIGDKTSDIKCGDDFGVNTILVKTGSWGKDNRYPEVKPNYVAEDLLDAAWFMARNN
ncbi:HAD-IIIA family hydrolase [Candidatus Woesearchaeota archaeon]|nr:HAD-IIIA family hydrolase [Candidatus Woesearchaeota archaeon]